MQVNTANIRCPSRITAILSDISEELPQLFADKSNAAGSLLAVCDRESGYSVCVHDFVAEIHYAHIPDFCRAVLYLGGIHPDKHGNFPVAEETCLFREFGIMIDNSRNAVLNSSTWKKVIRIAALLGYTFIGIYMEDTFSVVDEPYFGYMRGTLKSSEIRDLSVYAEKFGMELRPYIQTLAHLNQITRYESYQQIIDTGDILLADNDRTYEFLDHLIGSIAKSFGNRFINIGMDEAQMIGLGKYLDVHGYSDRLTVMQRHLDRVLQICRKYGFRTQMWSDMFFKLMYGSAYYEELNTGKKIEVPDDIELCYWDYYSTEKTHYDTILKNHLAITDHIAFAGGAWKWTGFAPHNRYSCNTGKAALASCKENGIQSVVITAWGDDGAEASVFGILPTLYRDAEYAYDSSMSDDSFKVLTGLDIETFFCLDDVNPYPEETNKHNNASKYLLYQDVFMGVFDSVVKKDADRYYDETADILKKAAVIPGNRYAYLFETEAALCNVLRYKASLGNRIHDAYDRRDLSELRRLANDVLPSLSENLRKFYDRFKRTWYTENKPFGFEVQTIRIGGLLQRLTDASTELSDFIEGTAEHITELEEQRLPFGYFLNGDSETLNYNLWQNIVTTGVLG